MARRMGGGIVWSVGVLMLVGAYAVLPRVEAQRIPAAVRLSPLNVDDGGTANKIDKMGETFYALENKTKKVTTKFKESEAVAERDLDGTLRSKLVANGAEIGKISSRGKDVEVTRHGATVIVPLRVGVQPTLDWLNIQNYAIVVDNPSIGQGLEWQQKYMRARGKKGWRSRRCGPGNYT